MTHEQVLQAARVFVISATGYGATSVVVAPYDGTRPALPYISVQLTSPGRASGQDESHQTSTSGSGGTFQQRVIGHRVALLTVEAFGAGCFDAIEAVRTGIAIDSIRRAALAAGISPLDTSELRDLTQVIETGFELRAQVDLRVGYVVERTANESVIDTVVGVMEAVPAGAGPSDPTIELHLEAP